MIHRHAPSGTLVLVVAVVLAVALLLPADGHVAQAQSNPRLEFSLIEDDPLVFQEDVGTVRFGIRAETIEAGTPTSTERVRMVTTTGTALPYDSCALARDYHPVSEEPSFSPGAYGTFVNGQGETRYSQTQYFEVSIWDDRILEEDESFTIEIDLSPGSFSESIGVGELELTIVDNDGFVGVAFDRSAITVTEGTESTYRLALGSLPSGNVTVTIVDPSNTEVTAEPGAVTFTPTDWYVPRTVTVAADHDATLRMKP